MPSVKPDYKEISALRKERKLYDPPPNLFGDLYEVCRSSLKGSYVTMERAEKLISFLRSNAQISAIYPNSLLYKILTFVCTEGNWSPENVKLLLNYIAEFYLNYTFEDETFIGTEFVFSVEHGFEKKSLTTQEYLELIKPPNIQFSLLNFFNNENFFSSVARELMFDHAPVHLRFRKNFVGFTGNFNGYTRKTCFEEIRKCGGVPSDSTYFLDYFFVASKSIDQNVISSQLALAIYFRSLYGKPLIFTEKVWHKILYLQQNETGKNT